MAKKFKHTAKVDQYNRTLGDLAYEPSFINYTVASDLNNCITTGFYVWAGNQTANKPLSGDTYGICLVFVSNDKTYNNTNNWVFQIAIRTEAEARIWVRRRVNSGSWQEWKQIGTV